MFQGLVERGERTRYGAQVLTVVRLALAAAALLTLAVAGETGRTWYVLIGIVCGLTVLYSLALRWMAVAPVLAFIQIVVDMFLETWLIFETGGILSPFVALYPISIVASSLVLSRRGALFFAALATILLASVTITYHLHLLWPADPRQMKLFAQLSPRMMAALHLSRAAAFFLVAWLSGTLARRLFLVRVLHEEILESLGEGVLVLDRWGRALYHNSEAARLLGHPQGLLGQEVERLFAEAEGLREALGERRRGRLEIESLRTDGAVVPLRLRLIPVGAGRRASPGEAVLVLSDISAERRAEEALCQSERFEAISEMAASIAHEIRNPLASIRGSAQEIQRAGELSPRKTPYLEIILAESDRLERLVGDFLKFAKMRPAVLRATQVRSVFEGVVSLLQARPEAKNVTITCEVEGPGVCWADPEQLRQVLLNLGLNALEALDDHHDGRILLRARPGQHSEPLRPGGSGAISLREPDGLVLEVQDNGPGMAEEVRRRLFDPFYTTKKTGSGLGLAIVARIVRTHGGLIRVLSAPGQGASFHLWLPSVPRGGEITPPPAEDTPGEQT